MPDLDFRVTRVAPCTRNVTPLLEFGLTISNCPDTQPVQAILLNAQLQLQAAQRPYNNREKEKLVEVFGPPEAWGQTLRNRLWAHATASVGGFTGSTEIVLPVPCSCDLNLWSTKYFEALEGGDVSVLFLFSGSVFYGEEHGRLQVMRISWNKECAFRMPAAAWQELMDRTYPNTRWVPLSREAFERLSAYKRGKALMSWEATMERLLAEEAVPIEQAVASPTMQEVPA